LLHIASAPTEVVCTHSKLVKALGDVHLKLLRRRNAAGMRTFKKKECGERKGKQKRQTSKMRRDFKFFEMRKKTLMI